jgi:hypothetical protein
MYYNLCYLHCFLLSGSDVDFCLHNIKMADKLLVCSSGNPYLHQRPIFFKTNSSIVAILELIRGAQCLIEVIRCSGEEM